MKAQAARLYSAGSTFALQGKPLPAIGPFALQHTSVPCALRAMQAIGLIVVQQKPLPAIRRRCKAFDRACQCAWSQSGSVCAEFPSSLYTWLSISAL